MLAKCDIVNCIHFKNFRCNAEIIEITPNNFGEFEYITCGSFNAKAVLNESNIKKHCNKQDERIEIDFSRIYS